MKTIRLNGGELDGMPLNVAAGVREIRFRREARAVPLHPGDAANVVEIEPRFFTYRTEGRLDANGFEVFKLAN